MLRNPGLRKSVEQPVLDLNFAASQIGSNAAPDSRIDFSRGSNAWFVDTDGLVKKSPHNLQVYSQDFDNAAWSKSRITVSANATTAPDGTLTADKIVETSETGAKYWRDFASAVTGERYFFSVFAKAAERKYLQMWTAFGTGGFFPQVWNIFDVEAGTITRADSDADSVTIEDVGNGWFRCTTSITADGTGLDDIGFGLWDGVGSIPTTSVSYTGDGSSGLFVWGAQFSHHSTAPVGNPYVKTTGNAVYAARLDHDASWFMSAAQEQNLLRYSEMLDDSYWTKSAVSVTANAETDPLGGTTAEYVFATSPSGIFPAVVVDFDVAKGVVHTLSFYAKKGERDQIHVDNQNPGPVFNENVISNAELTSEWQRFTGTFTPDENTSRLAFYFGSGAKTWSGDQGFYLWGLQVEVGSTASTYHRTEGAPYYGEGATPRGLLVEEARTNLVEHSEEFDDSMFTAVRLSVTANQSLAPDGTSTADEIVEDSSASDTHILRLSSSVTTGNDYTFSVFAKRASGTRNILVSFRSTNGAFTLSSASFDLGAGTVTNNSVNSASIEDYGNGWFRCSITETAAATATARLQFNILDGVSGTYTGDGTSGLFLWGAQLEEGSFPTSYIKNSGTLAGVTRNADVATMGPTVAPDKLGTELLVDGDFPSLDNFSQTAAGNFSVSGGILEVEPTANFSRVYQSVPTEVGKRYRASVFGRTESSSDGYALYAGTAALGGDATAYGKANSQTTDFLEITLDFTATTTTAFIGVGDQGSPDTTDSHFFHTLSLKEILPGTERVTNGTFDIDGDETGWQDNSIASTVSNGVVALTCSVQYGKFQQYKGGDGAFTGAKTLHEGRRYRATVDVTSYGSGQWQFALYDDTNAVTLGSSIFTSSGTKTFDCTMSDATNFRLWLTCISTGTHTASFDNVSVRELYPFEQYNPSEGTVVCDFDCVSANTKGPFHFYEGTGFRGFGIRVTDVGATSIDVISRDASTFNSTTISSLDLENLTRTVASYNASGHVVIGADGNSDTQTANTINLEVDRIDIGKQNIGGSATGTMSGHIRRLRYLPRFVSEIEAKNLTSD